jgi:hypothetical protein
LAQGLNNLAGRLIGAGDEVGTLAVIREAVAIRRRLAATNPARFEPDLAQSLYNLSIVDAGNPATASSAIREAVDILRRLNAMDPARFRDSLQQSLERLREVEKKLGNTPTC